MSNPLLLDTCALIWLAAGGGELTPQSLERIENASAVFVSSISAFEISLKNKKGGIELPCDAQSWYLKIVEFHGISEIPINHHIAGASVQLPDFHKDPCDRFIIATAMIHRLPVVTGDKMFANYDIDILL
ncbi:MAG: type II toxin-antitoxin system VapC family toxin [Proteobacteria bacterium]|nr:type II toxin-antitoxin system VapC family toxin [Pseudomonadota bacterium]